MGSKKSLSFFGAGRSLSPFSNKRKTISFSPLSKRTSLQSFISPRSSQKHKVNSFMKTRASPANSSFLKHKPYFGHTQQRPAFLSPKPFEHTPHFAGQQPFSPKEEMQKYSYLSKKQRFEEKQRQVVQKRYGGTARFAAAAFDVPTNETELRSKVRERKERKERKKERVRQESRALEKEMRERAFKEQEREADKELKAKQIEVREKELALKQEKIEQKREKIEPKEQPKPVKQEETNSTQNIGGAS